MEQLIRVQILAQNIIEFPNAMTAGLEAVLDNKLSPSLVSENLLGQDFRPSKKTRSRRGPHSGYPGPQAGLPAHSILRREARPATAGVRQSPAQTN